jgi:hypothetical protein
MPVAIARTFDNRIEILGIVSAARSTATIIVLI